MKTLTDKEKQEVFLKGIHKGALETIQELAEITTKEYGDDLRVYLAGGALRDAAYSRFSPRDIDVFVVGKTTENIEDSLTWLSILYERSHPEMKSSPVWRGGSPAGGKFHVERLANYTAAWPAPPPIDIIHHPGKDTIEEVVSGFDYELVKAWYDPYEDSYKALPEFWDVYLGGRIIPRNQEARYRIEAFRDRERSLKPKLVVARNNAEKANTTTLQLDTDTWRSKTFRTYNEMPIRRVARIDAIDEFLANNANLDQVVYRAGLHRPDF